MFRIVLIGAVIASAAFAAPARAETGVAIFAGGCFWCVESDFDKVKGVTSTVSGYIGGKFDNPTYENHSVNGDREAVEIKFDPAVVSYPELLKIFFRSVDPTDDGGQFCDRGYSYTTAIYALDEAQANQAKAAKAEAQATLGKSIVTEIAPEATFWPAEDYHQDFYKNSSFRYNYYRKGCGRDRAIESLWGSEALYGINKS